MLRPVATFADPEPGARLGHLSRSSAVADALLCLNEHLAESASKPAGHDA